MRIKINETTVLVPENISVLEACRRIGVKIPTFCHNKYLARAGSCRMCLVEIDGFSKLVPSCSQEVREGMVVRFDSFAVLQARKDILEMLLINHPLDCLVCDKGGECSLQDNFMDYGGKSGKFYESKRTIKDKTFHPLIKTHMSRCIQCTLCTRFMAEIGGEDELGIMGRGELQEISSCQALGYKEASSELAGNVVDLCPVGALTFIAHEFYGRSWELSKTASIDISDAVCSNIWIESTNNKVIRILPRENPDINESWISDKARFLCHGLDKNRITHPMVRDENGGLQPSAWIVAYERILSHKKTLLDPNRIAAIAGVLTDVETMFVTKELLGLFRSYSMDYRRERSQFIPQNRFHYIFNSTIAGIDLADACLIVGANPRFESSILNARIRKNVLRENLRVFLIGEKIDLGYGYTHLSSDVSILQDLAEQKSCHFFDHAKYPMLIFGEGLFDKEDAESILWYANKIARKNNCFRDDWNGFNVLHNVASKVGAFDVGFFPKDRGLGTGDILRNSSLLLLLGADEIDLKTIPRETMVVYIGHHFDKAARRADIVFPGSAYTEKDSTYVNLEGRVQRTKVAARAPGEAKEDWAILNELTSYLCKGHSYSEPKTLEDLRGRMMSYNPIFSHHNIGLVSSYKKSSTHFNYIDKSLGQASLQREKYQNVIGTREEFYLSNSIARNSNVLLQLCNRSKA